MTEQETHERTSDILPEESQTALPDEDYYRQPPAPRQTGTTRRLGMLLLIVGLIWLAIELFGYGPFYGTSQDSRLIGAPLPGNRIELDLGSADVDVQRGNDRDIHIETTQRGVWQGDPVEINRLPDRIEITNRAHPWLLGLCLGRCNLHYSILVPHGVAMSVRTSSGDISATGLDGAVSLTTGSGDVLARDIVNGLAVESPSGDVILVHVAGKLDVRAGSGDVKLEDGNVTDPDVQTSSGDIVLEGVGNSMTLKSSSGDITVRDAFYGRLKIETSSGDVDYVGDLAGVGDNSITTASGDVTLELPAGAGFILNAGTRSGDLHSDFELPNGQSGDRSLTGTANAGGPTLRIATSSGDISVEQQ
jgi:DUF4097 and DUF4098 domain-containing protein YvlB